jgi:hypothetical protein
VIIFKASVLAWYSSFLCILEHQFEFCAPKKRQIFIRYGLYIKRDSTCSWLTTELLLVLASTVILGLESRGTHNHILLSHVSGSRATSVPVPA